MKRIIAIAALAALATAAHAADDFYKVSATQSFSTRNVYKIDTFQADKRFVRVFYVNGGETSYADNTGDLLERIVANQPELTHVSGTSNTYVNAMYVGNTSCVNGKSTVWIGNSVMTVTADDNCALVLAVSGKAK